MKYVICYSGGHSSAIAAIETVRRFGKENVILLNHNISAEVEHDDIKRFKNEVADYLGLNITYANMKGWETKTPLRVCKDEKAFKVGTGTALCTNRLKTQPFYNWLKENFPIGNGQMREDVVMIYGFDLNEQHRIQRRVGVMATMGYKTDYPLIWKERTIFNTEEIGIDRPLSYKLFRHANCIGCLKAGKQQWYIVYCLYPKIWEEAKETEREIGYSILKDDYLEELEPLFHEMKYMKGICPSEKIPSQTFWARVEQTLPGEISMFPCECAI